MVAIRNIFTAALALAAPISAALTPAQIFVRVHQVLLNILIGKAGLFTTIPFIGQPVAAVLRQVEGVVDTIAFGIIDLVESRAADLQREANNLGATLDICINSYDGLSTK
ncbi:hypothetical protein GGP41_008446 [Bipolaris sorokiniana]|uniref:Uncharacterized protein n=1 Tax=Cochliobolus sativus TaxID=45130 RepID=A0A8H5Z941_COCSA|nr:hypothetical protein GGP41_008446 [Bipolaris sorokiniana]